MSKEQIQDIIKQHDTKGDNRLSFEEFSAIFVNEVTPNTIYR